MNQLLVLVLLFTPTLSIGSDQVVPEDVINSWGYRTVSNEYSQRIKRIKKLPGDPPTYPRFFISKECFESDILAIEEDEKVKQEIKSTLVGFKTYRDSLVHNSCIYALKTDAHLFYLDHQPQIFSKFKAYVTGIKKP